MSTLIGSFMAKHGQVSKISTERRRHNHRELGYYSMPGFIPGSSLIKCSPSTRMARTGSTQRRP
ncbi:hypothetical protein EOD41_16190 [Mucilaginibacter limnophilus]|uniref:Uncharacterized protein n=1 Tax=Mucilaginibacter limnophilus TaxID=1932778 RepID=A0A3S2UMF0_9SPHI|nr:hypothetical protein [Mucilaginibacter limnophilus]RVT98334.1 hypothetical protein EOD41_16190 [Mucilaginibacter limnophilus]